VVEPSRNHLTPNKSCIIHKYKVLSKCCRKFLLVL
jgi:hypothetical protein